MTNAFGVGGFMNCSKSGGDEGASAARDFLPDLKPNQVWLQFTNKNNTVGVNLLITAAGGPDTTYSPLGANMAGVNPWRYVCPGTNNPASYDLWVDLSIGGQTNLICNWTKEVQKNTTLP